MDRENKRKRKERGKEVRRAVKRRRNWRLAGGETGRQREEVGREYSRRKQ